MAWRRDSRETAVGATLLAAVLWGTSFSVNDLGLRHMGPGTFVFLRFAMAGALLLALVAWMGRLDATVARRAPFWLLIAANAGGFLLQYLGQTMTTPARTALFVNTSAFAVAILERFFFHLRIGPRRGLAILVGVAGAVLLLTGGDPASRAADDSADARRQAMGDLLALASGLAWSVYFVMNRKVVREEDPWNLLAWTFTATAIMLLPALLLDERPLLVPREAWPALLYTGAVTTALAYGLWTFGLRRIRATTSAVLLLVEILVASLVSLALGRETFGWADLAGALLLVAAVVAISWWEPTDNAPAG